MVRSRLTALDRRFQLEEIRAAARGERPSYKIERGTYTAADDDGLIGDGPVELCGVRHRRQASNEVRGRALDLVERSERTADHVLHHDALEFAARAIERDDSGTDLHAR